MPLFRERPVYKFKLLLSLSVYFPHGDGADGAGRYAVDLRTPRSDAEGDRGQAWTLDVTKNFSETESGDPTTLGFDVSRVPEDQQVYLFDRDLRRFIDLRIQASYSFSLPKKEPSADPKRARFELLAGSDDFIRDHRLASITTPFTDRLFQNSPNPFRTDTTIRYEVAKLGLVQIDVFDIQGRLVRSLLKEVREPGRYETAWDGKDDQGRETGPGIYFYHVRASGADETRRMIRVR